MTKATEKLVAIQELLWEMGTNGDLECVTPTGPDRPRDACGECVQCKLNAHVVQPVGGSIERGVLDVLEDEARPMKPFPIQRMESPFDVVESMQPDLAAELRAAHPDKTIVSVIFEDGEAEPVFAEGS